jgi:hypothetical protein
MNGARALGGDRSLRLRAVKAEPSNIHATGGSRRS